MGSVPSVNILIPTYNQAESIARTIDSALKQTYQELVIIVADDCSSDNTKEIVLALVQKHPKKLVYRRNTKNLGRVANYRKALYEYANADWVANLDGDDYYTDCDFISHAIETLKNVGLNETLFYQGSKLWIRNGVSNNRTFQMLGNEVIFNGRDYYLKFGKLRFFSHMSTLYNRQLALQSGFYGLDVLSSDIYSFLKLAINFPDKKVIVSKRVTGCWVRDGSTASESRTIWQSLKNTQVYFRLFGILAFRKRRIVEASSWIAGLLIRYLYWNTIKRTHKGYSVR